jgi:hypothetical protein
MAAPSAYRQKIVRSPSEWNGRAVGNVCRDVRDREHGGTDEVGCVNEKKVPAPAALFTSIKPVLRAPRLERFRPVSEPPVELDATDFIVSVPPPPATGTAWEIELERSASARPDPEPISLEEIEVLEPGNGAATSLLLAPSVPTSFELSARSLFTPPAVTRAEIATRTRRIGLAVGAGLALAALGALGLTRKPLTPTKTIVASVIQVEPALQAASPSNAEAVEPAPVAEVPQARPALRTKAGHAPAKGVSLSAAPPAAASPPSPPPRVASASAPPPARPSRVERAPDAEPQPRAASPRTSTPWSSGAASSACEFSPGVAMQALRQAADRALTCRTAGAAVGSTRVAVTFAPSGQVAQATLEGPLFVGTPIGTCIVAHFQKVRIAPFEGSSTTVRRTILF